MVFIQIDRKLVKAVFIIFITISLGLNICNYVQNRKLENRYKVISCIANQFDIRHKDVEIFDISKGEVIKKVQLNPAIRKEVEEYLKNITGMYGKVKALPEKGYIIRVPMEPFVNVNCQWLTGYGINSVDEVFILFPEKGKYLLVLDSKYRPLFYNFDGNTDELLNIIDF
jgi:hypothetical protein